VSMLLRSAGSFMDVPEHMRLQLGNGYEEAEFFTKVGTAYVQYMELWMGK
jgi:hypothetical protein